LANIKYILIINIVHIPTKTCSIYLLYFYDDVSILAKRVY